MSFATKSALTGVALIFSATVAFAQVGGGDVPTNAKKKGTMENGSSTTGMKKNGMMKKSGGMMKKDSMKKKM